MPCNYRGLSSFPNSATTQPQLMLDGDTVTYYTSALPQRRDSWIAVDLKTVKDVHSVRILQGRNSVDDVDYFDHAALEYSADGKTWQPLIADIERQYVINWSGTPVKARYVRLKRLDSRKTNYVAVRSFEINPLSTENLGFGLQTTGNIEAALRTFDLNASSSFTLDGTMTFDVTEGTKGYTLLMGKSDVPLSITMLDDKGNTLQEITTISAYTTFTLPAGTTKVKLDSANADIIEIIPSR